MRQIAQRLPNSDLGVRRLAFTAGANVLASIGAALAGLAATAVMARQMTVDEFGRVLLLLTAANAIAIFEGLRPVIIVRAADPAESWIALFNGAARVNITMAATCLLLLAAAAPLVMSAQIPFGVIGLLALTVLGFFAAMQYWAFLDAATDTLFTGAARGIAWVLVYTSFCLLSLWTAPLWAYASSLLAMQVVLALVFRRRLYRLVRPASTSVQYDGKRDVDSLLGAALQNIVFNISAVTINLGDRSILGALAGAGAAGLYSGPSELTLRAGGLVRAAVQVVLPWAAQQSTGVGYRERLWVRTASMIVLLAGAGCGSVLLFRSQVTRLLLGPTFVPAADVLGLLSIALSVSILGYACIVYLNAHGNFSAQRKLYVPAALLLLAGAYAGAREGNIEFVAAAFLLARCVDLALAGLILLRCERRDAATLLGIIGCTVASYYFFWHGNAISGSLFLAAGASVFVVRLIAKPSAVVA